MNRIDRLISWFSPESALRRVQARGALAYYEAAKPSPQRQGRRESGSGDVAVARAGASLREQARHLEQNLDIASGALDILVTNIVGGAGIGVEPQPRTRDGKINEDLAAQISRLWRDFCRAPEVTGQLDMAAAERLAVRSWMRDGEIFAQQLVGNVSSLNHGTVVPYSFELMESDLVPFDFSTPASDRRGVITQGVEHNGWGRPMRYHVYKDHPGDYLKIFGGSVATDYRVIPAERMIHLKVVNRIRQTRGVSIFANVLQRLDDLKEYEDSERIAAKVAASMCAYIKRGSPDLYSAPMDAKGNLLPYRDMTFVPGLIFGDLAPGEEIGTIDSKRPSIALESFRNGQLRMIASGMRVSFSSLAKTYEGSFSSQRQELAEAFNAYGVLQAEFICRFVQPIYEMFISAAILSGVLIIPRDVDQLSIDDALFIPPTMPWIDPMKEAKAWEILESNCHASGPEIIRKRGQNPADVREQEGMWRRGLRDAEINVNVDPQDKLIQLAERNQPQDQNA